MRENRNLVQFHSNDPPPSSPSPSRALPFSSAAGFLRETIFAIQGGAEAAGGKTSAYTLNTFLYL